MELNRPAAKKASIPGLWTSVGVIAGAIVAATVVLYVLAGNLDAESSKIVADKAAVAQQSEEVTILAHLKSDAAKAVPYTAAMQQLLPTHDALIGFQQWFGGIGQANNVVVIASFAGGTVAATTSTLGVDGFSFIATGALTDLTAFLQDAEANTPGFLLSVDGLELISEGNQYQLKGAGRVFSRASS